MNLRAIAVYVTSAAAAFLLVVFARGGDIDSSPLATVCGGIVLLAGGALTVRYLWRGLLSRLRELKAALS